jgi:hypothetical protein
MESHPSIPNHDVNPPHVARMQTRSPSRRPWVSNLLIASTFLLSLSGCFGYRIGTRSLYRNDVRTINVPVVRSDSFRPELGVQLTEAVQKEIERRTPYKLADAALADSIMAIRLTNDSKRVIGETNTDEPRVLENVVTIELKWTDRRGMDLVSTRFAPPGETTHYFAERNDFVPEAGQSVATSFQRLAERLANHIVDQMETRW